jgi:hypothetical protein
LDWREKRVAAFGLKEIDEIAVDAVESREGIRDS